MKRINITLALIVTLLFSCKEDLDIANKNAFTLDALNTEVGITQFATNVYANMFFPDATSDYIWVGQAHMEIMGDGLYIPWGNYSWRWANQPSSITLDDGTVVTPPDEGDQGASLEQRNTRAQGQENAFNHFWNPQYYVINTANVILQKIENDEVVFGSDADEKKKVLRAWALWWKAWGYSTVGSMYTAGLIMDEPNVISPNPDYVSNDVILDEAEKLYDEAITLLNTLTFTSVYEDLMKDIIPVHFYQGANDVPTPDEWIRNINTMKARDLMVNQKVASMTSTDWNAIKALADIGLQSGDFEFLYINDSNNWLTSQSLNYRVLIGWHMASERLIQDFKAGDARFTRNFELRATARVNDRGRGIQYGTRYDWKEGDIASTAPYSANIYIAGSYEENELMRAEALIRTGSLDAGLTLVDDVRTFQNSGLANVSGTGLSSTDAIEELRRERRVGLMLRAMSFYDARRWGVIDDVSNGGGRTGCVVLDDMGNVNTNATINYKYLDYWSVPAGEFDFNAPSTGSAPIIATQK